MKIIRNAFLNDPEVIQEVNRYKWIESERIGADVGFDVAAARWLDLYADSWVNSRNGKRFDLVYKWIMFRSFDSGM